MGIQSSLSAGAEDDRDILEMGHRKHMIHAFVEVDVTRARRFIREYEADDRRGSLLHSIHPHLLGEGGGQEQVHARLSERAQSAGPV